ncbi:MAG: hypothetical protein WED01_06075 [Candidatus Rokuibacteriota bacterium]
MIDFLRFAEPEQLSVDPFDELHVSHPAIAHRHLDSAEPFLLEARAEREKERGLVFRDALGQTQRCFRPVRWLLHPHTRALRLGSITFARLTRAAKFLTVGAVPHRGLASSAPRLACTPRSQIKHPSTSTPGGADQKKRPPESPALRDSPAASCGQVSRSYNGPRLFQPVQKRKKFPRPRDVLCRANAVGASARRRLASASTSVASSVARGSTSTLPGEDTARLLLYSLVATGRPRKLDGDDKIAAEPEDALSAFPHHAGHRP